MVALALLAVSCAGGGALQGGGDGGDGGGGSVVVGAVNFAENLILGEMYAALLEDRGVSVDLQPPLSSREVLFPAVESGEVDLVPEYTGALLDFLTGGESTVTTPDEVYAQLQEELPEDIV
ncbi:MAG: glycine/betaine ABC transporter substrate-binding protein, partial [Actinomycetota bacterium]|nr:glycine/betaine ABC transporter substrate-binding protein [Actinomycetota bacterium]